MTTIVNMSVMDGPGATYDNGWRRVDCWQLHNGGQWGDDAIAGFTSYYERVGTDVKAEVSYYVEPCSTDNLPEVRDAFHVEMYWEVFHRDGDDGDVIEIESAYDYGSVLYYDTFDAAWKECVRLRKMDEANSFGEVESYGISTD
jgi:hypothetical protein